MTRIRGVSLLEILLSLVLAGILILGIYFSQAKQTPKAVTLKQYMLASFGLRNMAEKMLANLDGSDFYLESFKTSVKDCISLECDTKEIAEYDINTTVSEIKEYLPDFKLKIADQGSYQYKLTASWQGVEKNHSLDLEITLAP